jgi:hypothetical protein
MQKTINGDTSILDQLLSPQNGWLTRFNNKTLQILSVVDKLDVKLLIMQEQSNLPFKQRRN